MNRPQGALPRTLVRGQRVLGFAIWYLWEFLQANAAVAWEVVSPRGRLAPGIVELPLRGLTRLEIVSIANLLTLTPGTLTLSVTDDPPTLYVHGMHAADPDRFRRRLQTIEDRMLAAMRPAGAHRKQGRTEGEPR